MSAKLAECLRERQTEIERATIVRAWGIADPAEVEDPAYVEGLRGAVRAGVDFALGALEVSRQDPLGAPVPAELLAQARYAARAGVSLETVTRRYFAGHALLVDFIAAGAEELATEASELQRALRREAALVDRLLATVSEEYSREASGRFHGAEQRRVEQVRMLLDGEFVDIVELGYRLDAWHIGLLAAGPGAAAAVRDLATALDRSLLLIRPEPGTVWAWLGGRSRICVAEARDLAGDIHTPEIALALGEPGRSIEGWRLTHRQARAAFPLAVRPPVRVVRHVDVALLATALRDEVLAASLRDTYLAPLEDERDGGETLRQTLSAYLATGGNVSATAARLGTSRKTVNTRIRMVEERLGREVGRHAAEIQMALRLESMTSE